MTHWGESGWNWC